MSILIEHDRRQVLEVIVPENGGVNEFSVVAILTAIEEGEEPSTTKTTENTMLPASLSGDRSGVMAQQINHLVGGVVVAVVRWPLICNLRDSHLKVGITNIDLINSIHQTNNCIDEGGGPNSLSTAFVAPTSLSAVASVYCRRESPLS